MTRQSKSDWQNYLNNVANGEMKILKFLAPLMGVLTLMRLNCFVVSLKQKEKQFGYNTAFVVCIKAERAVVSCRFAKKT